jgi:hypothetical protein
VAFACLIAFAGCGGGGDESSTAASAGVPQVTTPGRFDPGTRSTPTGPQPGGAAPAGGAPSARPALQELAPFRDCLSRHGVDPAQVGLGLRLRGWQGRDPAEVQRQIQAGIACIPELPPPLRAVAERLKRRYEQRTAPGS